MITRLVDRFKWWFHRINALTPTWGWLIVIAVVLAVSYIRPTQYVVDPVVEPVVNVFRDVTADCPKDWIETGGSAVDEKGLTDPSKLSICTSPDKRYILTYKDGTLINALDTAQQGEAQRITPEQVERVLR